MLLCSLGLGLENTTAQHLGRPEGKKMVVDLNEKRHKRNVIQLPGM